MKSVAFYSVQIHFYMLSQNDIRVQELLEEIKLQAYDLWRTLETFLNFDSSMPQKLREHFLDLERQIV